MSGKSRSIIIINQNTLSSTYIMTEAVSPAPVRPTLHQTVANLGKVSSQFWEGSREAYSSMSCVVAELTLCSIADTVDLGDVRHCQSAGVAATLKALEAIWHRCVPVVNAFVGGGAHLSPVCTSLRGWTRLCAGSLLCSPFTCADSVASPWCRV